MFTAEQAKNGERTYQAQCATCHGADLHSTEPEAPDLTGLGRKWAITPEQCAEDIARGLERNARTVVSPKSGWLFIALGRLFPATLDSRLEKIYWEQQANR